VITPPAIIKWLIYLPQEVFLFLLSSGERGGGGGGGSTGAARELYPFLAF